MTSLRPVAPLPTVLPVDASVTVMPAALPAHAPQNAPLPAVGVSSAGLRALQATTLAAKARAALGRTAAALSALQQVDGRWDTPFTGGSVQVALGCIALSDLGLDGSLREQNQAVIAKLAGMQNRDGGFSIVAGEPSSPAATRLVQLALHAMLGRDPGLMCEPSQRLMQRTAAFLAAARDSGDDSFYALIADLVSDCLGAPGDRFINAPLAASLSQLGAKALRGELSELALTYVPAIGLLVEAQSRSDCDLAAFVGALGDDVCNPRKSAVDALLRSQDADGAWGWNILGTTLAVLALRRNGHTLDNSRALRRAATFIHSLRTSDVRVWTRGDAWDTGLISLTLGHIGKGHDGQSRAIDALLHGQLEDGRFSFGLLGQLGDNDTTSTVLRALCAHYERLDAGEEKSRVRAAIRHCVEGLTSYQQGRGGWGAFSHGALLGLELTGRRAGGTESAFNDGQTPDLSGRVLSSMLYAIASGALDAETTRVARAAVERARDYLVETREPEGAWWSRWIAGTLSGFAFIVPALRHAGVSASSSVFAKSRGYILAKQNADGGWGEEIAADRDRADAGRGRSSASHTASAIIGLIGTLSDTQKGDRDVQQALARGVDYLLRQERDGVFSNGRSLYTALSGLDYYDADGSTTCFVAAALALYDDFVTHGPEAAMRRSRL